MIIEGDCLDVMKAMADNSISCIVTDPPYGLGFMGKKWDAGLPHAEIWKEALRVVKPGGHILAFSGTRTYHRLTCAIEDAGWEIRDCVYWLYGSGFPKSHNHFGLEGYGTALKPAIEPCIMGMKPLDGTFAQNAEKWGQAGINIDESRIGFQSEKEAQKHAEEWDRNWSSTPIHHFDKAIANHPGAKMEIGGGPKPQKGRWPANVIFDEEAGKLLDEQSGRTRSSSHIRHNEKSIFNEENQKNTVGISDSGGASRFFYCAKASSAEREEFNKHPTVKPLKLMEYLIKLVMPPKDGVLLDPFAGSGSTIVAAHRLGFNSIGIEKQPEYCEIARARLENCKKEEPKAQLDLFTKSA